jgi:hypothetical protein
MWHTRKQIYLTSNPNFLITAVQYFPNINKTVEDYKENNNIALIQKDEKYRDILAYYHMRHTGRDFIPLYFGDDNPKLGKLDKLYPQGHSFFWCIGYVSDYVENKAKALLLPSKRISTPRFNVLLDWLEYHSTNFNDSVSSNINKKLAEDCLRRWVTDHSEGKVESDRLFKLIYNCSTIFDREDLSVKDWIKHLETLPKRYFHEIIVNDFK